jgi:hypothetical protein
MKVQMIMSIVLTALVAGLGGWFAARYVTPTKPAETSGERKILYYQSAMHPWIKSDKPGNCTICGMKLVPVYEGEKGFEASADIVSLPTNSISVVNVQTELVGRRPLTHTLRVAGRIDDDDTRHRFVSAYVDGRIEKLFVNYVGAEVVEGQPLATFYSPQLLSAEREYLALLRMRRGNGAIPRLERGQSGRAHLVPGQDGHVRLESLLRCTALQPRDDDGRWLSRDDHQHPSHYHSIEESWSHEQQDREVADMAPANDGGVRKHQDAVADGWIPVNLGK